MDDVFDSICNLKRLALLDLEDCKKLRKLPRNFHTLGSLETLVVSGCSNLVEFQRVGRNKELLKEHQSEGTIINTSLTSSREVKPWYVIV